MHAVRFHDHGGPDVLALDEVERPSPSPGEVLVDVEAAAINPVDTYFREGAYPVTSLPWIAGSDVAGVVEEVGEGVERFAADDRVFGTGFGKDHPGTCAEYVAAPESHLASLPEGTTFAGGAAVALVGVTAWDTLIRACDLTATERALIHGGSGGVGHVAVQIAAAAGARVTATASPDYHDRLGALGVDDSVDYSRSDLAEAIIAAGPPDVILDHRLDEYLPLDAEVAADGATVAAIGNEESAATFPDVSACRGKALSVHHVSMFNVPSYDVVLERIASMLDRDELDPVVARLYDLDEVPEAQRAVFEDSFLGKLVVDV
ncbi:MAG: alcohol dehydrogenase catalytic domain-containing protein [Haloarculaceae archaeon]